MSNPKLPIDYHQIARARAFLPSEYSRSSKPNKIDHFDVVYTYQRDSQNVYDSYFQNFKNVDQYQALEHIKKLDPSVARQLYNRQKQSITQSCQSQTPADFNKQIERLEKLGARAGIPKYQVKKDIIPLARAQIYFSVQKYSGQVSNLGQNAKDLARNYFYSGVLREGERKISSGDQFRRECGQFGKRKNEINAQLLELKIISYNLPKNDPTRAAVGNVYQTLYDASTKLGHMVNTLRYQRATTDKGPHYCKMSNNVMVNFADSKPLLAELKISPRQLPRESRHLINRAYARTRSVR